MLNIYIVSHNSSREHRALTKFRHLTRFLASTLTSFHVLPSCIISSRIVLRHVVRGLPGGLVDDILYYHISTLINLQQISKYSEIRLQNLLNVYASVIMYITREARGSLFTWQFSSFAINTRQVSRTRTGVSSVLDSSQDDLCFLIHSFNEKAGLEGDECIRMGNERKWVKFEIKKEIFTQNFARIFIQL